jgi:hypothetical protein
VKENNNQKYKMKILAEHLFFQGINSQSPDGHGCRNESARKAMRRNIMKVRDGMNSQGEAVCYFDIVLCNRKRKTRFI